MSDNLKTPPQTTIQLPTTTTTTTKVADEAENGPLVSSTSMSKFSRNYEVMYMVLRILCLSASLISITVMISAKEKATISIYGFDLPLYSKWSFSGSFQYLVSVSVVVAVHSLLQLVMTATRKLRKSTVFSSRKQAWFIFACDQVFAYVMISAGSASIGVSNLNRTGIKHASLPNFCKPLHSFCDRVGVSIAFAFFNCVLLAISAILDVIWLAN